MRIAIFALTLQGGRTARRIQHVFPEAVLYINKNLAESGEYGFAALKPTLQGAFQVYDALICVMATGIVVRCISACLKGKQKDPAVLVVDEKGKFVISLLSGHIGQANDLTRRVASRIDGIPVITTATDLHGILAPDTIASRLGLHVCSPASLVKINASLLQGKSIQWWISSRLKLASFYQSRLKSWGQIVTEEKPRAAIENDELSACLVFLAQDASIGGKDILYLRPRKLVAGIGCRKNTSYYDILNALRQSMQIIDLPLQAIEEISSAYLKTEEVSLKKAADYLGIPCRFILAEELDKVCHKYHLVESPFVKKIVGAGSVCEAAALAPLHCGSMAMEKKIFGKVTVALAWEK